METLLHCSLKKPLTMSDVIPHSRKEGQHSLFLHCRRIRLDVARAVAVFENCSGPPVDWGGWKTQHDAKEIPVSASSYQSNG